MNSDALHSWKQRIFEHQQSAASEQPQQGTLFELTPNPCDPNNIDPFTLELHNLSFCDKPDWGDRTCLYFVIDNALPLLLYVGETHRTPKQRWANHYCHSYIGNYIELHRRYSLDVSVAIAFWYGAPSNRQQRLQLELELIYKWKSPFNKECWQYWGQR
ncbi:GIY-YIG nuclease family protein [Microcoleus sp. B4-D4]|uniref:GIY-YIG nuclease family protein n=1 Tax=Microcoleus sp. B4-D4 TaxID=2818667 RepID=UPI002FCF5731